MTDVGGKKLTVQDNEGTLPVNLRAFALGTWDVEDLDDTYVKVTKVEYYDGAAWQTIIANDAGIAGIVYYSPDGQNNALYSLASLDTEEFQLTVLFDSLANNDYQGETYTATVTAEAKQTNDVTSWS